MGATKTGALAGSGTGARSDAIVVPSLNGTTTLTNSATGSFTYAPNANFSGTDRRQFTVTDSVGTSNPATVPITFSPASPGALSARASIGVSTYWVCYWCAAQPYVDVLHQASMFAVLANGQNLLEEGELDANGWPELDFRTLVLNQSTVADNSKNDPSTVSTLAGNYQLFIQWQSDGEGYGLWHRNQPDL